MAKSYNDLNDKNKAAVQKYLSQTKQSVSDVEHNNSHHSSSNKSSAGNITSNTKSYNQLTPDQKMGLGWDQGARNVWDNTYGNVVVGPNGDILAGNFSKLTPTTPSVPRNLTASLTPQIPTVKSASASLTPQVPSVMPSLTPQTPAWQDKLIGYNLDRPAGLAEISRASDVYNQKKAAGDMAGANAAHNWANQIRSVLGMGAGTDYNPTTGASLYPQPVTSQPQQDYNSLVPMSQMLPDLPMPQAPEYDVYKPRTFDAERDWQAPDVNSRGITWVPTNTAINQFQQDEQAKYNASLNDYNAQRQNWSDQNTANWQQYLERQRQQENTQNTQTAAKKAAYEQAFNRWSTAGVVLPGDDAILGVPAGTLTSDQKYRDASVAIDQANAATAARKAASGGSGGSSATPGGAGLNNSISTSDAVKYGKQTATEIKNRGLGMEAALMFARANILPSMTGVDAAAKDKAWQDLQNYIYQLYSYDPVNQGIIGGSPLTSPGES